MRTGVLLMPTSWYDPPALLASVSELQAQRCAADGGTPNGDTGIHSAEGSVAGIVADVWRYLCKNPLRELRQKLLRGKPE
jgi:hypothetical protein